MDPAHTVWGFTLRSRSPGFRSSYRPRLPILRQWHFCGFRPDYSRWAAGAFNPHFSRGLTPFPCSRISCARSEAVPISLVTISAVISSNLFRSPGTHKKKPGPNHLVRGFRFSSSIVIASPRCPRGAHYLFFEQVFRLPDPPTHRAFPS